MKHPKITFITDKPKGDIVLASSDPVYMREHLPALLASCVKFDMKLHYHCINPDNKDLQWLVNLNKDSSFTISYEDTPGAGRTYFACNRFLVAYQILKDITLLKDNVTSCFITDIDAYFMAKLPYLDCHVGLYFRVPFTTNDWENLGSHVAAGAVYVSSGSSTIRYLEEVCETILYHLNDDPNKWFVDQVALYCVYAAMNNSLRFLNLNCDHQTHIPMLILKLMDWEFQDGSILWTGKGDRKHHNQKYLAQKKVYEDSL